MKYKETYDFTETDIMRFFRAPKDLHGIEVNLLNGIVADSYSGNKKVYTAHFMATLVSRAGEIMDILDCMLNFDLIESRWLLSVKTEHKFNCLLVSDKEVSSIVDPDEALMLDVAADVVLQYVFIAAFKKLVPDIETLIGEKIRVLPPERLDSLEPKGHFPAFAWRGTWEMLQKIYDEIVENQRLSPKASSEINA